MSKNRTSSGVCETGNLNLGNGHSAELNLNVVVRVQGRRCRPCLPRLIPVGLQGAQSLYAILVICVPPFGVRVRVEMVIGGLNSTVREHACRDLLRPIQAIKVTCLTSIVRAGQLDAE